MRQKFSHLSFEERKTISRVRGQKFNQSESPDPALSAEWRLRAQLCHMLRFAQRSAFLL